MLALLIAQDICERKGADVVAVGRFVMHELAASESGVVHVELSLHVDKVGGRSLS